MGFSLEHFLTELQEILDEEGIELDEMISKIEDCVTFNRTYAIECGQLKDAGS